MKTVWACGAVGDDREDRVPLDGRHKVTRWDARRSRGSPLRLDAGSCGGDRRPNLPISPSGASAHCTTTPVTAASARSARSGGASAVSCPAARASSTNPRSIVMKVRRSSSSDGSISCSTMQECRDRRGRLFHRCSERVEACHRDRPHVGDRCDVPRRAEDEIDGQRGSDRQYSVDDRALAAAEFPL